MNLLERYSLFKECDYKTIKASEIKVGDYLFFQKRNMEVDYSDNTKKYCGDIVRIVGTNNQGSISIIKINDKTDTNRHIISIDELKNNDNIKFISYEKHFKKNQLVKMNKDLIRLILNNNGNQALFGRLENISSLGVVKTVDYSCLPLYTIKTEIGDVGEFDSFLLDAISLKDKFHIFLSVLNFFIAVLSFFALFIMLPCIGFSWIDEEILKNVIPIISFISIFSWNVFCFYSMHSKYKFIFIYFISKKTIRPLFVKSEKDGLIEFYKII